MTYIEFFDKTAIENICTSLACVPERVILIGDKLKMLITHAERYRKLFLDRGADIEFICRSVSRNELSTVVSELSEIVETYDDCVFDLTGGDELYLVAVGIISERYKDKHIQMHRINISNGNVIDCDQDGNTLTVSDNLRISVEENIRVYGGDVVYDTVKPYGTHVWDMNEEFREDIASMWEICKDDVRAWNAQVGIFEAADSISSAEDPLVITADISDLEELLSRRGIKSCLDDAFVKSLFNCDLITAYDYDDEYFYLSFKNEQVKRCLTKAGLLLEMFVYMTALDAKDKSGEIVYNDVMTGVCIDWDGEIHDTNEAFDTENEIDVIMMHGLVPVFVSCKNGYVDTDELYKLSTVAERFGGKYAKKVLVATALDAATSFDEHFRQRARNMNINLVEGLQEMSEAELGKTIRNLWCGNGSIREKVY